MIHIEQHQLVPDNNRLRVFSVSGDYSDNDAIECYTEDEPDVAVCSYQAQFIKYGGLVYRFNTPEELGAALVQIDPESTHNSALLYKEDEERRKKRLAGTLVPENPVPADENLSPIAQQEAMTQENEEALEEDPATPPAETPAPEPIPTPTPEPEQTPPPPVVETSTSTPSVLGTSTTTPTVVVPDATSTPSVIENSAPIVAPEATSTPEIISMLKKKVSRRKQT